MQYQRLEGRSSDSLRSVSFRPHCVKNAAGSVEVQFGGTRVLCCASVEDRAPTHAVERNMGWVTAEYSMLPASTHSRIKREASRGKLSGRTMEIQRLIGRALRSVVDLKALEGFSVWVDCDVLEADGGTRTASITGGYVALVLALKKFQEKMGFSSLPILEPIAAISVGVVGGQPLLDLDYSEDSNAQVDMNVVMTESRRFVELQATAEESPFPEEQLVQMKDLAALGIQQLIQMQKDCIQSAS